MRKLLTEILQVVDAFFTQWIPTIASIKLGPLGEISDILKILPLLAIGAYTLFRFMMWWHKKM